MDFIKFEPKHILGIKEIDDQHREIYKTVSHLFEIQKKEKKEILKTYGLLLTQLKDHFETEENLMKKNDVVEFISHKLEHDRTLQKYTTYYNEFQFSKSPLNIEMLKSLKNWLEIHFEKKDIKLQLLARRN
ncbi:MAG: hemerythrin family protein [Ignavibacteriae bacterium]|nr:hemerythrin family protein [Ignavibacteriota bacterium]